MKIAMVTPRYPPRIVGGGEMSCKLLVEELRKTEEVDVFALYKVFPNIKSKLILNKKTYRYLSDKLGIYEIIHTYNMDLLPCIGQLTKDKDINSYATLNGIRFSPSLSTYTFKTLSPRFYRNKIYMKHINKIKSFSTLCEYWRKCWIADGIDSGKISVITNMLDPTFEVKERVSHSGINLLHVGNFSLTRNKEIVDVIEIFSKLSKQDIKLTMVGKGTEEKKRLVKIYSPVNQVDIIGSIDNKNISQYYAEADIFLHPSILPKGNDRVIIEAMQHGCIVLTHCSNELSPIIRNGIDGVLIYPSRINDFYLRINELIQDEKMRKNISENAKKRVYDVCSPEKVKNNYLQKYKELLDAL